jgi:hypothetical protein
MLTVELLDKSFMRLLNDTNANKILRLVFAL